MSGSDDIVAVACDHGGFALKPAVLDVLREAGLQVLDLGTDSEDSVDYPDFAAAVARKVAAGGAELGLIVCGTGIGVAMAANKVDGVRAATCNDLFTARMSRAHNDANVLTLGARVVGEGLAEDIVQSFVETRFEAGRHQRRLDKIGQLE